MRGLNHIIALLLVLTGCSSDLSGTDPSLTKLEPDKVCDLPQTLALTGQGMSPLVRDAATSPSVVLPSITLRARDGGASFELPPEALRWEDKTLMHLTLTSEMGLPVGVYDLILTSGAGQRAQLDAALDVQCAPVTGCPDGADENACGGCAVLEAAPGEACGDCRSFVCDGSDQIECVPDEGCCPEEGTNPCGGCETLDQNPGDACGDCLVLTCEGLDALACVASEDPGCDDPCEGGPLNACGGCETLQRELGSVCGECGRLQCEGTDALVCGPPDDPACGGEGCDAGRCVGTSCLPNAENACLAELECADGCRMCNGAPDQCCVEECDRCRDCKDNCRCHFSCRQQCEANCRAGSSCALDAEGSRQANLTCTGGNCELNCADTESCELDCRSGSCNLDCSRGSDCELHCSEQSNCSLRCDESAGVCELLRCEAPVECPGGVIVCNRDCP